MRKLFVGQAVIALILAGLWTSLVIPTPLDHDYTGGELLDHTLAWKETGDLYVLTDRPPYRVLNYPPTFLALVRGLQGMGLPPLPAGRLLSLLSFLGGLAILDRWLRERCRRRHRWLVMTAFLGSSYPALHYIGQFHLQWLAVGLTLLGFFLLRDPHRSDRALLAGLALALACFVKQTQLFFACLGGLWLLSQDRRSFSRYLLSLGTVGAAGMTLLHHLFGPEIWRHLLTYTVGTYSWTQLVSQLEAHFLPWAIFMGISLAFQKADWRKDLRWWFLVGSSVWLLATAREGAGPQYFIEWNCAILLWLGPFLCRWMTEERPQGRLAFLYPVLLLMGFIAADINVAWNLIWGDARELRETTSHLPALCRALQQSEIPVPIEEAGLARACGRQTVLQPFIMSNLALRGLWNETPFVSQLNAKAFPVLLILFDPRTPLTMYERQRWTPAMIQAIRDNYRVEGRYGKWWLLRPSGERRHEGRRLFQMPEGNLTGLGHFG